MLERALLLNIPLRVGAHGGMWVCFTCAGPAAISRRVFGKVSSRKTRLVLKLRKFKMYDTGGKLNGNYLIPLKLFLVECYS